MSEHVLAEFIKTYGPPAGETGPERFVREVLGAEPDEWQIEGLRAYGRGDRRISVKSCHGPGKTALAAWCATHQLCCRFPQRTACTAPSKGQLFDALFAEIKIWLRRLPEQLGECFELKSDRIELKIAPEDSYITARTARKETPEALQGIHSQGFVLLIPDEASGIHEKIFESAQGSMSGHFCTTLMLSNPVRTSGYFFDSQNRLSDRWFCIQVGAAACDAELPSHAYRSKRVSDEFVREIADTYGPDSNAYRVRCLGEFPRADDDTIIPYELVQAAKEREIAPPIQGTPVVWGLDVARFGDDATALTKRQAYTTLEPTKKWRGLDNMQVAGRVKAEWDQTPPHLRPAEICIDVIGWGAGVVDRLRELNLPVIGVNVSESPALGDKFVNLTTELWFMARDWFQHRDCYIHDSDRDAFSGQLTSRKYKIVDSNGRIRAESKDDMKKRGLRSPDEADSFILTFAGMAGTLLHGTRPTNWGTALKRNIKGVV